MVVAGIVEIVIGIVAVVLGILAILFRVRYTAWQNRVSRPNKGQEITIRLTIITGAILIFVGIGIVGIGFTNLVH